MALTSTLPKAIALAISLSLPIVAVSTAAPAFAQSVSFESAETVIGGQMRAFRARKHDEAFGYASPNIRKMFGNTDRFVGMVKSGYSVIYGAQSWTFGRNRLEGKVMYQEVDIIGPDGFAYAALYTLEKQADGTWRIAGVQVRKGAAVAT
ncbi:DUF4864 domain-containing protein [Ahrensia sp. R2A130]|uniref:DUF4864 domain-containing protein n=1 Tax=Ahrensia sp. R2A130 TaxID=744979 RepID=UPI0001E0E056|nr:DUF4864 domain-containing protein [Ahrensia sp. R2A130]EFL90353.1 conserved hypothetical protein [Ahrensia sp. R2A130]